MTLAMAALFADAPTTLANIGSWRVKETDRIAAMATELRKLGATVEEGADWLRVTPPTAAHRSTGGHRHLRRSPHGDVLLAGGARRRAGDDQRPRLRAQDVSRLLRALRKELSDERALVPSDRHRRSVGIGQGHGRRGVARALGFHYLDSGALYRLVALRALQTGTPLDDAASAGRDSRTRPRRRVRGTARSLLDGEDVTDDIRSEDGSAAASQVAVHPAVRAALLDRQRAFRRPPGLVADGRDMGTVVFPDAALKVFLTASAEERARRRYKQLIEKGISVTMENLLRDIRERDARDPGRATAPLRPAADAKVWIQRDLTIDTAIHRVLEHYRAARGSEARCETSSAEG